MGYESLSELIKPYIDLAFEALPLRVRRRIKVDASFMPDWDGLTPNERFSLAQQIDVQHDPGMAAENGYWDGLDREIRLCKREIEKWELMQHQSITEATVKESKISALKIELIALQRQLEVPFGSPSSAQTDGTPAPMVTESEPMLPAPDTQAGQVAPVVELSNGGGSTSIFHEMADLNASELTLAFVGEKPESGLGANNMLEVTARGQKRRIALASLDLVDKRKGTPNGECGVLLGLVQGLPLKKSSTNTQKMKRLRTVFLHHFGIVKDPFEPYMAATGWIPLFKIVDRRGAADERAKKEAEERMVSLEQLEEQGVQQRDCSNNDADSWMKENGYSY